MDILAATVQIQAPAVSRKLWLGLWLASMGVLIALLAVLTIVIEDNPESSLDFRLLNSIVGWDLPGLVWLFAFVSFLTSNIPGLLMALSAVGFLWLLGLNRESKALFVIWMILGLVVYMGDATFGEWVGRGRPFDSINDHPSYPSGHVFGSTVMFGFWLFIAGYYGLKSKLMIVGEVLLVGFLLLVGASRIHVQEHWPSDVAAGYLMGMLWLLVLIPLFLYLRKASWFFSPKLAEDPTVVACETCRTEKSIASVVVLNPEEGTATKVYKPPPLVGLLYWIAFQAKFPYTCNAAALEAAVYRRRIAGILTLHRFGKDLVSPATGTSCDHGNFSFVTEYVPGSKVPNDAPAQKFLGQVAELFAEAGLGVWQINPRNPHAHTNLILTPEGDYKIIDLESAVVTVLPAKGQLRSAIRSGNIPIFDDIDFTRLNAYIDTHQDALTVSLGSEGLAEFRKVSGQGEVLIREWKESEPRILGRAISKAYRLLNVKAAWQHVMGAVQGADTVATDFLKSGIDRWEKEGTIEQEKAESLRAYISSGSVNNAIHHMGAHMVLSVVIAVPIPGLRSAARFLWTLYFWFKFQLQRLSRRNAPGEPRPENIHNPLVMFVALIPGFGAVAYLGARPLRQKIPIRLMLDQAAWKLPFKIYRRLGLDRWFMPNPSSIAQAEIGTDIAATALPSSEDMGTPGQNP